MNELSEDSIESLSFEEAFSQLERIITSLERGNATMDESLSLYEKGKALADHCSELLNQAELKVKLLSGDEIVEFESSE